MKRKLVQHGDSTLMMSLPAHWLREKGLKKGDSLELVEQDGALILKVGNGETKTVFLDARNLGCMTKRAVEMHYKVGYDHLDVALTPEQAKEVQLEIAKIMPGYEIIGQKEGKYTIKDISGTSNAAFDSIFRKIMMITANFAEEVAFCIETRQFKKLPEARILEDSINKLTVYALRLLNKWGYPQNPSRSNYVYLTLWAWEHIGDELKFLCDHYSTKKPKISPACVEILKEATAYVRHCSEHFFKHSNDDMAKLSTQRKALVEKLLGFESNKDETILLHHLINIVNTCYSCIGCWLGTVY